MFSTCCARGKVTLLHFQEPPALLKAYFTKNDAQSREFRQKSMSGLPPHKLLLKIGAPVILLQNINPSDGLCNRTRLICCAFAPHVIEVQVMKISGSLPNFSYTVQCEFALCT